jgi:hypothetical protein
MAGLLLGGWWVWVWLVVSLLCWFAAQMLPCWLVNVYFFNVIRCVVSVVAAARPEQLLEPEHRLETMEAGCVSGACLLMSA